MPVTLKEAKSRAQKAFDVEWNHRQYQALNQSADQTEIPDEIDLTQRPDWFHEGQAFACDATESEMLVVCAAQSGKTACSPYWLKDETIRCREFIRSNKRYGNGIFAGPTEKLATAQAIPTFQQLWEHELQLGRMLFSPKIRFVVSAEGCRRLVGSAETPIIIHFPYASDPNNIESVTAYAAAWDEAGQTINKQASYFAIKSRRLMIARSSGFGRLSMWTTPYEWGWLKTLVHDPVCGSDGKNLRPIRAGSDVLSATNGETRVVNWPAWLHPANDKETCFSYRDAMPDWEWQMTYQGLYSRPAGVIYDCWDADNEIDKFDIPDWWRRFVGIDFGPNNTAAIFIAEEQYDYRRESKPTGRYIVYRTYKDGKKTSQEHVQNILKLAGGTARPIAIGGSHAEQGWREAFGMSGLGVNEPQENDVEVQISRMYAGIKTKRLVAFRTLSQFIGEVHSYSRELGPDGQPTEKIANKSNFHRMDGSRYVCDYIFRTIPVQRLLSRFQRGES